MKMIGTVLMTLTRIGVFLIASPLMRIQLIMGLGVATLGATVRSDFQFSALRHDLTSIFLVLPPNRLDAYSRWLRLLVAQALQDIARDAEAAQAGAQRLKQPALFLLDEFAALGRLEAVERAMGLMAGYGLQLWPILQDMSQLKDLYGARANTFVANAGVLQTFGVNDF